MPIVQNGPPTALKRGTLLEVLQMMKVTFGRTGVEAVHPIGQITEYEMGRLQEASDQLATEIQTGLDYAAAQ